MIYRLFSEANLEEKEDSGVYKNPNWVSATSSNISSVIGNDKSAYIDLSNIRFNSNDEYITYLCNLKNKLNTNFYIIVPLESWLLSNNNIKIYDKNRNNPISALYNLMKNNPSAFRDKLSGIKFIFYTHLGYFSITSDRVTYDYYKKFSNIVDSIYSEFNSNKVQKGLTGNTNKKKSEKTDINPMKPVDNKKANEDRKEKVKEEIADAISSISKESDSVEDALDKLDNEGDYMVKLLSDLSTIENNKRGADISARRQKRINELDTRLKDSEIRGRKISDILNSEDQKVEELPSTELKIDSINEEWSDLKFVNFNKIYDMDEDIVKIFNYFSKTSYPISIVSINVEDTSTYMDYIDTYTVKCEDVYGKKYTWVVDIPQLIDNRYMMLRGNEKIISGQLALLPCTKTDPSTVQIVSNYNKIFVRLTGSKGKSTTEVSKIIKLVNKFEELHPNQIKISRGCYSTICSKYKDIPMDYIDLSEFFGSIEIKNPRVKNSTLVLDFDQDRLRSKFEVYDGIIPYGYSIENGKETMLCYYSNKSGETLSYEILSHLHYSNPKMEEIFNEIEGTEKCMCSVASILNTRIPVIVILGYLYGFSKALKKAKINFNISSSKRNLDEGVGFVKIGKEYVTYPNTYSNSILMNGFTKIPDIDQYSIADLENRSTWINILGDIKDKLLSDGLENFNDLFVDPITKEVCNQCGDATDFAGLLIEANALLANNSFNKHTDISVNRYRCSEIIPGYLYNVLSKAYATYANALRKGRKDPMAIKRSAVIDAIMLDPTQSDKSTLSGLMDIEAGNAISFKGLSGLNSDRAYGLDKRTFDDSMVNKIALSTGFAGNVGITRQSTIDMDIEGKRGYIKPDTIDDMSVTKTFSVTEAITPFGVTHDDPFRSAMTFIQTSKHCMRTKAAAPLLITNGTDEAIPHITTNKFAYKAKDNGKVAELVENDYMIITYDSGDSEYIDLKETIEKNSDGGMYILLQLTPDFKLGKKFKKGDIIAHDKMSFSNFAGATDNLSYNVGTLVKVALPNSDSGYEDSTGCSEWMTEALASDVVIKKDVILSPNTNVYFLVKPGQEIQEGEPLILFQNSFEEKDANLLLKNITDDELVSDLGRIRIKSHYTGWIQDVEIFRTNPIDTYSESIQKLIKDYDKRVNKTKALYKKYNIEGINKIKPDYPLSPTGELKNVGDGVKINIYIKYRDKFSIGDKNVAQSAAKGVNKEIYPRGKEPRSEYRPDEPINSVYAIGSFNARMIDSVLLSGAINKGLIELDRQVKEIMGLEWKYLEEIQMMED